MLPIAPPTPPFKIGLWKGSHWEARLCVVLWQAQTERDKRNPRPRNVSLRLSSRRLVRALSYTTLPSMHFLQVCALGRLRHPCILGAPSHFQLVVLAANDFFHRNCCIFGGHTMGVDIRLLSSPLPSRPSYPNFFPPAANRLSKSGRIRGTPWTVLINAAISLYSACTITRDLVLTLR